MKTTLLTIGLTALGLLVAGLLWLHSNRVWVSIDTQGQREQRRIYAAEGHPDDGEQCQTVIKF